MADDWQLAEHSGDEPTYDERMNKMAKTTAIDVNVLDSDIVHGWVGDVANMGSERIRAVSKTLEVVGEYQRSSAEMKQDFKRVVKMLNTLAGWLER